MTVPWDADVEASASVGVGSFDLFGNRQSGVNLKGRTHSAGQPGASILVVSGRAGAGDIVVERGSEPFTHEDLRSGQPVPMQCVLAVNGSLRWTSTGAYWPSLSTWSQFEYESNFSMPFVQAISTSHLLTPRFA